MLPIDDERAILTRWHIADGATVKSGDAICELATGTATVDLPAPHAGVLRQLAAVGTPVTLDLQFVRIDPA